MDSPPAPVRNTSVPPAPSAPCQATCMRIWCISFDWARLEHARPGRPRALRPWQQHRPRQPRPPPGTGPGARPATVAMSSQRAGPGDAPEN